MTLKKPKDCLPHFEVKSTTIPYLSNMPGLDSSLSHDYWEETVKGIANCLAELRRTWYTYPQQYCFERHKLEKYVNPLKYGAGATIFLFLTFRVTGSAQFQSWRKYLMAQRRPNAFHTSSSPHHHRKSTFTDASSGGRSAPPAPPKGYLEAKREREVQAALSSMRLITDILVSVSTGTSGSLMLLHAHEGTMRQDFEQAPLVSGRSVVADEMCTPFLNILDSYKASSCVSESDNNLNLRSFLTFTENCRARRDVEARIRTERSLPPDSPVSIPYLALELYRP